MFQSPRTVPRLQSDTCLVIVGGAPRLKTDRVSDAIFKYDAGANNWEHVTTMPEPRHHHAGNSDLRHLSLFGQKPLPCSGKPTCTRLLDLIPEVNFFMLNLAKHELYKNSQNQ